jgi:hypothetical protein
MHDRIHDRDNHVEQFVSSSLEAGARLKRLPEPAGCRNWLALLVAGQNEALAAFQWF